MIYLILEWTGTELAASRFLQRRGELLFQGSESRPAATDAELAAALGELSPAGGDCRIALSLPLARLFLREMELPIRDRRKLREVLPLELKGETALDSDELAFAGLPLAGGQVLALWGRKRELAAAIGAAAAAGMEPEVLSAAPLHWGALLPAGTGGTAALADGSALAVFRDGEPLFFRALTGGEECARTLALLEMGKGISVDRTYRLGPSEGESGSLLPVEGSLAAAFGGDEGAARRHGSAWSLAMAMLRGEAVDFRAGDLAWTRGKERALRQLRLPLALAALLILLLAADAGIRYTLVKRDLASLDASIGAIYREVFPGRKRGVDEAAEMRAELKRLGAAGGTSRVLETLNRLADAKGDEILGLYEVEIDGARLRLKGDARSSQAVSGFQNRLAALLAPAEVGQITSKPDGTVTFVLRGTVKEEAQ
uniref:Type II secretion system protein GspL n=1 Tax=Geobacter metallireducens TaxID=28232 RepID=A0A831U3A7_GEOME